MSRNFKLPRWLWLFYSADLTFLEVIVVFMNRLIFTVSRTFYYLKNTVTGRDPKVFYGYQRHLSEGIKPKGYCLLAYLAEPIYKEYFLGDVKFYFSNNGTPLCVLCALNKLGYVVDVIDYRYTDFVPKRDYDLFFFHQYEIYDALKQRLNKNVICIEFETTAYWRPMVEKIRQRISYFKQRHNLDLPESEYNHFLWMEQQQEQVERVSQAADGVIVIGDQLAKSFKLLANPHIKLIKNAVYYDSKFQKDISVVNLERGRRNFLFFGGGRDVMRKGVDILLEAFLETEYQFYMCIGLPSLFEKIYKVSEQKNIHNLGYLKVGSKRFYKIINTCNFIIQPAAAEGVPGGVLETMKYGLIPVVSKESNIPEAKDIGYLLPDNTVATVKKAIQDISVLPAEILRQKAVATIKTINDVYSPRLFTDDIKRAIIQIVESKK